MTSELEPVLDILVTRGLTEFPEALGCCLILGPQMLHLPADEVRIAGRMWEIMLQNRVVGTMPEDTPWRFLTRELYRALNQPVYHRWRARCERELEEAAKAETAAPLVVNGSEAPSAPVKAPGNYL